jgi:hypothetical protein
MGKQGLIVAAALAAAVMASAAAADPFDDAKYPNWKGQWRPIGGPMRFDPSKGWGPEQQAPLTAEYEANFEANLADQAAGGQGNDRDFVCQSPGMPRVTNGYGQMEIVITFDTVHILIQHIHDNRRIFTDGRDWPKGLEPSFTGYSVGKWIDTNGSGRYNMLEIETRGFAGPRAYDTSGIPLHKDNQTIVNERMYTDPADPNVIHNEVTVIDHALTRPWSVERKYQREPVARPYWREVGCAADNNHLEIGKDTFMLSAEGFLMPTKKGQPPPSLKYFK